jgi:drug/metabolite transporter (DMT)-like permease
MKSIRPMRSSPAFATGMLTIVTLLWGLSFPLVKSWHEAAQDCPSGYGVASVTLIAVRMLAALAILAVFRPRLYFKPTRREHAIGAVIGLTFFVGFALQVLGPVIAFMMFRISVPMVTLIGLACGVIGTIALGLAGGPNDGFLVGDGLTFASSIVFAFQIILLDRLGRNANSAHFTVAFFGATALPAIVLATGGATLGSGIVSWSQWTLSRFQDPAIVRDMTLLVVLATVLAFLWMNTYQPRVSASRAALIYFLEPIFSSIFSVLLGFESVTNGLLVGGGLILAGNALVELPRVIKDARNQQS